MGSNKIQDMADYPCRYCKTPCTGMGCPRWQDCFKRSWRETIIKIKEAIK